MINAGEAVVITHELFDGSTGIVMSHTYEGGDLLHQVNFIDRDDGIQKTVFFKENELRSNKKNGHISRA